VTLAHPAWLLLLVLLPVIGAIAVMKAHARNRQWSAFVATRLRRSLIRSASSIPRWIAFAFLLAAIASLILGLSRPQGDTGTRTETSVGRNLLIALDLSRSMRVADVKPDRLTNAKLVIYELLEAMPNERIGLIGFAGNPYLYAPLTIDHQAVRETVEQMDETWPTTGGSDLGATVELGIATLKKTGQSRNALVIISDGEKHDGDLDEMIDKAKRSGVYILTIGVGTEDGEFVPHPDFPNDHMVSREGTPVISRLQADTLRQLASETNGAYASAGSGADLPAMIQSAIAGLDTYEMKGKERKVMVEFYQWLTLPAIAFLIASIIAGTRWRGIQTAAAKFTTTIVLLMLTLQSTNGESSPSDLESLPDSRAKQTFRVPEPLRFKGFTRNAQARYQLKEALAAYQQHDFKAARQAYSLALFSNDKTLQSTAHHGLGNTLFQLGWQMLSENAYPAKPGAIPDLTQFDTLVRAYLNGLLTNERSDSKKSYRQLQHLVTNWTDAVRHYDSSLNINPNDPSLRHNRDLTIVYLKRLAELMDENENQANQMMPPPPPQNQPPKPGDKDEKGDNKKDKQDPQQGDGDPNKDDKSKSDQENDQDPKQGDKDSENESESDGKKDNKDADLKERPGESPEQRARRILKENADIEKGPLTHGYREFLEPDKDW